MTLEGPSGDCDRRQPGHRQGHRADLRAEGAKVAFVYPGGQEAAEQLVKEINAAGGSAKAYQGDVADPACADKVVEAVLAGVGPRRHPREQRRRHPRRPVRADGGRATGTRCITDEPRRHVSTSARQWP